METGVLLCVFIIIKKRKNPTLSIVRQARGKYRGSYFAMDSAVKLGNWKVVLCPILKRFRAVPIPGSS